MTSSNTTQELLYKMLENLKSMARDIPSKYQQRLPYDMLSSLAQLLMNNTVFEIVQELVDLQHMAERHLHQQRLEIQTRHKSERDVMTKGHRTEIQNAECQGRTHVATHLLSMHKTQIEEVEERQAKESALFNQRILSILDEKVREQQFTLEQVGVPGFCVTISPVDVKVQMYILGFIVKLGGIKVSSMS